jgi:hypothetical protein
MSPADLEGSVGLCVTPGPVLGKPLLIWMPTLMGILCGEWGRDLWAQASRPSVHRWMLWDVRATTEVSPKCLCLL